MSISNYAELELLEHITGKSAFSMPTTVYIKLHTADPGEDCTTAAASNTSRQSVSWASAASGSIAASAAITWTNVSATETYSHWSMWDASTAGNPLWSGALSSSAAVTAGDTFQITALTLSLD
jgi:hypothetical protein